MNSRSSPLSSAAALWPLLGILGCIVALSAEGQAGAQTPPAPIQADGSTIRLLINPSGSQSFPGFIIQKFGLDKRHGFTLQTIPSPTTQAAVVAMQAGTAEIGAWNWPDIARMATAGTKVIAIGPEMKWANTIVAPADSAIKSVPDLKGKKFGIVHRTGLDWIIIRAFAKRKYGFDIQSALTMQEGAVPLLRSLLEQRQLDASIMYNDFTPSMVASGKFRQVARIKDLVDQLGIPNSPYILFAARLDYAQSKPQNMRAFLAAYRDACEILQSNDEAWVDAAKTLNIVDPDVVAKFREQTRPLFSPKFEAGIDAEIRKTFDVLVTTGGTELIGISALPDHFTTTEFQ